MQALKRYIRTLHTKPLHHKKRFSLLASGAITLVIFAFWSAIVMHQSAPIADNSDAVQLAAPAVAPVTPVEDVLHGISGSWHSITSLFSNGQ